MPNNPSNSCAASSSLLRTLSNALPTRIDAAAALSTGVVPCKPRAGCLPVPPLCVRCNGGRAPPRDRCCAPRAPPFTSALLICWRCELLRGRCAAGCCVALLPALNTKASCIAASWCCCSLRGTPEDGTDGGFDAAGALCAPAGGCRCAAALRAAPAGAADGCCAAAAAALR